MALGLDGDTGTSEQSSRPEAIQGLNLASELCLSSITRMPDFRNYPSTRDFAENLLGVVSNSNKAFGTKQADELFQNLGSRFALLRVVRSVRERIIRAVWMERKYVPKEDWCRNLFEHCPNEFGGTFGNRLTNGRLRASESPTGQVVMKMDIIGECHPRPAPTAESKIATDPQRIDLKERC